MEYEYLHVDMGGPRATDENGRPGKFGKPPWYVRDINPEGTVPAMYDNGVGRFAVRGTYTDDNIGHHFINQYGQGSGLLPEDPEQQNACRFFVAWCGGLELVGMQLLYAKDRSKASYLAEKLTDQLRQISAKMVEQSAEGPFFLGEQLTIAETHLAPHLDRWESTLAYFRNHELLPEDDPSLTRLREMLAAVRARPAFQRTSQPAEYYIWAERRTRWNANLVGVPWSELDEAELAALDAEQQGEQQAKL